MFWDIRILPVPEVPGPTSVAELAEKMKSMQYMIKVSERLPTSYIPQLTSPTRMPPREPVLEQTQHVEMMALDYELLVMVKQLDLAAVEDVHTTSTSCEEMVASEESTCQVVEDMLLGDSSADGPRESSQ